MTSPDPYAAALQDPEYLALLAQLQAALNNQMADYEAQDTDVRVQTGRQLREAGERLPGDLRRSTEGAAGRGMLYSGGLLEEQGDIQKRFADFNAQIGEDQQSRLNQIIRGRNSAQQDFEGNKTAGLQGAIQRALSRAQNAPVSNPANGGTPGAGTPGAAPGGAPGAAAAAPASGGAKQTGPGGGVSDGPIPAVAATPASTRPAPVVIPGTQMSAPTPAQIAGAAASNVSGRNDPSKPAGITNPILRPGDAPTPNSPLNQPVASPWVGPNGPVSGTPNTVAPRTIPGTNIPIADQPGGSSGLTGAAPAPVAAPRDTSRPMSSFDQASQTKLSLGQVVVAGDGRRMKYDPLTGRVVAV